VERPRLLQPNARFACSASPLALERRFVLSYPEVSSSSPSGDTVFDLSLKELLDCFDNVSVRLYNAVRFAASEDRLPYQTLGDYLQAGPERIDQMLRLPSLGRKSAHEFDELATRAADECDVDAHQPRHATLGPGGRPAFLPCSTSPCLLSWRSSQR
jgi:hypothetical protein